jgi:predicted regulator of Ras-like GTPase activity (Roadblock/LC7/MglB family)
MISWSGKVKLHEGRNQYFLDFARSDSYVPEAFSPDPNGVRTMASLGEVVRGLGARDGVEAVLVLSADGLPIEHTSRVPFEPEAVAALTATLMQYATRLGLGAGRGAPRTSVIDYERGLLIVAQIGSGDSLAILAAPDADIGELLYDLRQNRPALAALL